MSWNCHWDALLCFCQSFKLKKKTAVDVSDSTSRSDLQCKDEKSKIFYLSMPSFDLLQLWTRSVCKDFDWAKLEYCKLDSTQASNQRNGKLSIYILATSGCVAFDLRTRASYTTWKLHQRRLFAISCTPLRLLTCMADKKLDRVSSNGKTAFAE